MSDDQTLRAARILALMASEYETAALKSSDAKVAFVAYEIAEALRRAESRVLAFDAGPPYADTEKIRSMPHRTPTQADP